MMQTSNEQIQYLEGKKELMMHQSENFTSQLNKYYAQQITSVKTQGHIKSPKNQQLSLKELEETRNHIVYVASCRYILDILLTTSPSQYKSTDIIILGYFYDKLQQSRKTHQQIIYYDNEQQDILEEQLNKINTDVKQVIATIQDKGFQQINNIDKITFDHIAYYSFCDIYNPILGNFSFTYFGLYFRQIIKTVFGQPGTISQLILKISYQITQVQKHFKRLKQMLCLSNKDLMEQNEKHAQSDQQNDQLDIELTYEQQEQLKILFDRVQSFKKIFVNNLLDIIQKQMEYVEQKIIKFISCLFETTYLFIVGSQSNGQSDMNKSKTNIPTPDNYQYSIQSLIKHSNQQFIQQDCFVIGLILTDTFKTIDIQLDFENIDLIAQIMFGSSTYNDRIIQSLQQSLEQPILQLSNNMNFQNEQNTPQNINKWPNILQVFYSKYINAIGFIKQNSAIYDTIKQVNQQFFKSLNIFLRIQLDSIVKQIKNSNPSTNIDSILSSSQHISASQTLNINIQLNTYQIDLLQFIIKLQNIVNTLNKYFELQASVMVSQKLAAEAENIYNLLQHQNLVKNLC